MTGEAPPLPRDTGQQGTVGAGSHHLLCTMYVCVCVCVCVCLSVCRPVLHFSHS